MRKFRVVKDRQSEFPNPVTVQMGERVKVLERSDPQGDWPNWVYCKTQTNEGWIPSQIIEIVATEGLILETYDATEFDLIVGEILISQKELNGWIWAYKEGTPGVFAWAPLNHIEEIF